VTTLRECVSNKVKSLLTIDSCSDLYECLVESGVNLTYLGELIQSHSNKSNNPAIVNDSEFLDDINYLFSLGGIISGGAAVAYATDRFKTKDIDFYFNDDLSYLRACLHVWKNKSIDVCYYRDFPHELHDMGVVMANLRSDGLEITPECHDSFSTGVSKLFIKSVVFPDRTVKRMMKYNDRLGVKFLTSEVLAFCAIYKIDSETTSKLIYTVC
jgi:hypothetical protein